MKIQELPNANIKVKKLGRLFKKRNQGMSLDVVPNFLHRGEVMHVIADPERGRNFATWLTCAASVQFWWTGEFTGDQHVLHITNELSCDLFLERYRRFASGGWEGAIDYVDLVTCRGRIPDLVWNGQLSRIIPPKKYSLIVLDAFYCTLPNGSDTPDSAASKVSLMNYNIAELAEKTGCGIAMVTLADEKHWPHVITKYSDASLWLPPASTPDHKLDFEEIIESGSEGQIL